MDRKHEDEDGQRGRQGDDQAHVQLIVLTRTTVPAPR
jgi:hypothetical protein